MRRRKTTRTKAALRKLVRRFCFLLRSSCSEWMGSAIGPVDGEEGILYGWVVVGD